MNCHIVYTGTRMKDRTNIYLRPDQMKRLKALNKKTGAPVAELIRRAVDEYLGKRVKEK
ncbi:MAG: ribbon-helix-helix domain-containing protein [Candidatus Acidiferrales bacterium]